MYKYVKFEILIFNFFHKILLTCTKFIFHRAGRFIFNLKIDDTNP